MLATTGDADELPPARRLRPAAEGEGDALLALARANKVRRALDSGRLSLRALGLLAELVDGMMPRGAAAEEEGGGP